jgi:multisubunit Na+/H+ antiporter MnhB subunit
LVIHRIKIGVQIAGMAIAAVGVLCLPVGFGVNPKRDLSAFFNLADMGLFIKAALVLIPIGVIVLLVGYMLPGDDPEDML